jgi:hypothetical protein
MKQFVAILSFVFIGLTGAHAQTFLEDIQKQEAGQGTITVKESSDIDDLVNGKTPINVAPPKENKVQSQAKVEVPDKDSNDVAKNHETTVEKKEKRIVKKKVEEPTETDDENAPTIARKKIVKGGKKVNGYRVQVCTGNNTREGKQKAQSAGQRVKAKYPSLPVYVHFVTPRWICQVGNFSDRKDAEKVLSGIRGMGYTGACIVAGKITVSN